MYEIRDYQFPHTQLLHVPGKLQIQNKEQETQKFTNQKSKRFIFQRPSRMEKFTSKDCTQKSNGLNIHEMTFLYIQNQ